MKISRTYARACIITLSIGILMLLVGGYFDNIVYLYIALVFTSIAFIIKYFVLKCPYCGWAGVPPQWSKSGTIYCPKCGKLMEYDK